MLELYINKGFSDDELITKFNLLSDITSKNNGTLEDFDKEKQDFYINFEKRMNKFEKSIIEKIDKSNDEVIKRISKLETDRVIDEIKQETSITGMFNTSGKNALLKIFEYAIIVIIFLTISMMK